MNKYAGLGLFVVAFFLNPALACSGSGEEEPSFGETEMRAAVAGTYVGVLKATGESVTVVLDEAVGTSSSATQSTRRVQCSSRSFIRPAAACADMTSMGLSGTLMSSEGQIPETTLGGMFRVYGLALEYGQLDITTAEGGKLTANYDSVNGITDFKYTPSGTSTPLTFNVTRTE
jgi:hypothetical protein